MDSTPLEKNFYEIHLFCCVNVRGPGHPRGDCGSQGALDLQGYLKIRVKQMPELQGVRINQAGCLDRCELGPVLVIYPQGVWYHYRSQADMDEILECHIVGGELVQRLLLKNDAVKP